MNKRLKVRSGISLVALIVTIIILLILSGVGIQVLTNTGLFNKAKEAKVKAENSQTEEEKTLADYEKSIVGIRNNGKSKESDIIKDVTFEIKETTGCSILIQINTNVANIDDVRGYYVYINGEVVSVGENSLVTIGKLQLKTEYEVKCGVIDRKGNIKESLVSKVKTLEEEVLYDGNKYSSLITAFEPFRNDNASAYKAYWQDEEFYAIVGTDKNGMAGINTEKVDLTNINKIELDTKLYNNYGSSFYGDVYFGIYDKKDDTIDFTKYIKYSTNAVAKNAESKLLELDVSDIQGEYYIKAVSVHPSNVKNYGFYTFIYSLKIK